MRIDSCNGKSPRTSYPQPDGHSTLTLVEAGQPFDYLIQFGLGTPFFSTLRHVSEDTPTKLLVKIRLTSCERSASLCSTFGGRNPSCGRRVFPPLVGMRATVTAVAQIPDERMPQRGAYGVGLDTCCMVEVDPERFRGDGERGARGIPAELGELMSNVARHCATRRWPGQHLQGSTRELPLTSVDVLRRRPA